MYKIICGYALVIKCLVRKVESTLIWKEVGDHMEALTTATGPQVHRVRWHFKETVKRGDTYKGVKNMKELKISINIWS